VNADPAGPHGRERGPGGAAPARSGELSVSLTFVLQVIGWALATLVVLLVLDAGRRVLALVAMAVTIALIARPTIDRMARSVPRGLAVAIVFVVGVVLVAGLLAAQTADLTNQADQLADAIPSRIESLGQDWGLRDLLVEADVARRAQEAIDTLPQRIIFGTEDPAEGARLGLEALLVVILAVYAVLNGPAMARGAIGIDPDGRRRQVVAEVVSAASGRTARLLRRTLVLAGVSGLVAGGAAWLAGVPAPIALGAWAGVWSIVPLFGTVVGYAPIVLLASAQGPIEGIALGLLALAWTLLRLLYGERWLAHGAVRLGPLLTTVALVCGLRLGYIAGIVVALAAVGFVAAVGAELARRAEDHETPVAPLAPSDDAPPAPVADVAGAGVQAPATPSRTGGVAPNAALHVAGLRWRSGLMATVAVVTVIAALALAADVQPAVTWLVLGLVLGLAADPVAAWLMRAPGVRRGVAAALLVCGLLVGATAFTAAAVPSLISTVRDLPDEIPRIADDLVNLPLVGERLEQAGVNRRVEEIVAELPERLAADTRPLERILRSAGDSLQAAFWVLLVAVSALVDGPRLVRMGERLLPGHRREHGRRLGELGYRVLARYAAGSALIAFADGLVVFVVALVLGIPVAPLLGVWAMLWNFVPQIGGFMGGLPLVLFATAEGTAQGLVALVVFLVYMNFENRVLQPIVVGRAVSVSPLAAILAVLLGGAAAGVVGAVLATPALGAVKMAWYELRGEDSQMTDAERDCQV
jgi:putative heme transporter